MYYYKYTCNMNFGNKKRIMIKITSYAKYFLELRKNDSHKLIAQKMMKQLSLIIRISLV